MRKKIFIFLLLMLGRSRLDRLYLATLYIKLHYINLRLRIGAQFRAEVCPYSHISCLAENALADLECASKGN
jgi:hypothetical protein